MIRASITQVGILWLVIVAVVRCEAAGGQSDSPTQTVQAPSASPTSASDKAGTIPAIRRVTNVMDRYPQVSRDDKILLFDSNRSGTSQIYRCTLENNGAKPTDPTAPIYRRENIVQLTKFPFPARLVVAGYEENRVRGRTPRPFRNLCDGR